MSKLQASDLVHLHESRDTGYTGPCSCFSYICIFQHLIRTANMKLDATELRYVLPDEFRVLQAVRPVSSIFRCLHLLTDGCDTTKGRDGL